MKMAQKAGADERGLPFDGDYVDRAQFVGPRAVLTAQFGERRDAG